MIFSIMASVIFETCAAEMVAPSLPSKYQQYSRVVIPFAYKVRILSSNASAAFDFYAQTELKRAIAVSWRFNLKYAMVALSEFAAIAIPAVARIMPRRRMLGSQGELPFRH